MTGVQYAGDVIDLDPKFAHILVDRGQAEYIEREAATVAPSEKAIYSKARSRGN